jgi:CRP/FNR family cyclic AMP-dependent transcriptional regulator
MSVTEALKACALFRGFTDTGLQIIAGIATERSFPSRVPLFVENMLGDTLTIIADGRVKLTSKAPNGEEVSVGELGPGDYLGELSLIQQSQRMCTATAVSQVNAVEIRYADFQKLLAQKPQACLKLLMGIVSTFGQKVVENRDMLKTLLARK